MDDARWELRFRQPHGTDASLVINRFGVVSNPSPHPFELAPYALLDVDGFVRPGESLRQDGRPEWPIEDVIRNALNINGMALVVIDEAHNVIVTTAVATASPNRIR